MNQEFECIKIKDGLYIGNILVAHDYQFLLSNKFGFIVNCTAEIPNLFEHQNIQYLKFKLVQNKPHKLWDQTLTKLTKLEKFLQEAQQTSLCCLFHSFNGSNRSLVFVAGYLMKKYQWKLKKCLEFFKSKQIFIKLSDHYITQLELLQEILSKNCVLSQTWGPPYSNQDEQIISKTFINSMQSKQPNKKQHSQEMQVKKKSDKRVVWIDRLEKKKKKDESLQKKPDDSIKIRQKIASNIQKECVNDSQFNANQQLSQNQNINQKEVSENGQKKVYQLTINNFISPNFNIINKTENIVKTKKKEEQKFKNEEKLEKINEKKLRPASGHKKSSQKIYRAKSQKEVMTFKEIIEVKQEKQFQQVKNPKQQKQAKERRSNLPVKDRDVKKQLKKEIQKAEKQKSSHSSLHSLNPLSNLAQQLIKNQQGSIKRTSTPTKKERKKEIA